MSVAAVTVRGREYRLACDDGQEARLRELAYEVDDRLRRLEKGLGGQAAGHAEEMLLLVMAAITLADELADARREAGQLHEELSHTSRSFERGKQIEMEQALAAAIDGIAERVERMADGLESP